LRPTSLCLPLAVALFTAGCSSNGGQLGTLRTQNRSLLEQNNAQLAEIENLKTHSRRLADRLIAAEEELAARQDVLQSARREGEGTISNSSPENRRR
jgi:hypothetical protein